MIKYGLLHTPTQELLGFCYSAYANGEFCEVQFTLEIGKYSDGVWLVNKFSEAEEARTNGNRYYTSYVSPSNQFAPEDLEVVNVEVMHISNKGWFK